jgi:hypothetical protein
MLGNALHMTNFIEKTDNFLICNYVEQMCFYGIFFLVIQCMKLFIDVSILQIP